MDCKEIKQGRRRILLVAPPFYRLFKDTYALARYPLSLGYLAGTIKKETDWDVMVYNADFIPDSEPGIKNSYMTSVGFDKYLCNLRDSSGQVWRETKSVILEYKPDVVGISSMSQNFASSRIVAKLAKEINRDTIVVVGGPHPSMVGGEVLKCRDIDICVKGEGEAAIVELLQAIESLRTFDGIKGIVYRRNNQIIDSGPRGYIEDLDSLCFPHETAPEVLKDYDKYPPLAFKYIFATRGCPYDCFFCGSRNIWSRSARFRSPENIVKEIKSLQKRGVNSIAFEDDTFGINKQYISRICSAIMTNCRGVKWSSELHVKLANKEIVSLMKNAGCYSISLGIESGNNGILKTIRKNITVEEAIAACRLVKRRGIELSAFFIVGFPQETEETLNDTIKVMKEVNSDFLVYSIFTPYPGTEAFEFCRAKGLIKEDYDVSLYNHQSPANCFCMNMAPQRFRQLVSKIEKMVDRKNAPNVIKSINRSISLNIVRKLQELIIKR